MQFALYQVMSYIAETLLPKKKRNRPGLQGTENHHSNAPAALKTPGTFYKQTHKLKERLGTQRSRKALVQTPEGHQALKALPFTFSILGNKPPIWGWALCASNI